MKDTRSLDAQRPYKIFVSLLDKWEIGYALTDYMILDALISLQARSKGKLADEAGRSYLCFRPEWRSLTCFLLITTDICCG